MRMWGESVSHRESISLTCSLPSNVQTTRMYQHGVEIEHCKLNMTENEEDEEEEEDDDEGEAEDKGEMVWVIVKAEGAH